jgi:Protein of unknown function (DUF3987)
MVDPGVPDKRLLVVEPELASVLEQTRPEGNTLSATLRQAWDGGKLDTLVKNCRATATEVHVSVIGHITPEELRRKLTATEQANGFANRFLWIYARRSKELAWGGDPRALGGAGWAVEDGEEAVAGRLDLATSEPLELLTDQALVRLQ